MFQAIICQLPDTIQAYLYNASDNPIFNKIFENYILPYNLGIVSIVNFGYLGFGVSDPASLFLAFNPYYQTDMEGMGSRPILVYNPQLDFFVYNQSAIFFANLPTPLNEKTEMFQLDPRRGTALHCGVGSSANVVNYHLNWLDSIFPVTDV